jgi:hypothetical protein
MALKSQENADRDRVHAAGATEIPTRDSYCRQS